MKQSEKELQSAIIEYLTLNSIFHWRQNTGAFVAEYKGKKRIVRFGVPGISDILGVQRGRLFAIEVKARGGKLTYLQENFLKNVSDHGGIAIVARSLDDVIEGLRDETT